VLIYTTAIVGMTVLIGLLVFFWKQAGFHSSRAFGRRIATHLGIPNNVFHMLIVNGATDSSGNVLKRLAKSNLDVDQASKELGPLLSIGIKRLEARFGPQDMIDKVKPIVAKLVSEFEMKR
jgi:hypothetical protein